MKRSFTRLFTAAILACALSAASVQAQQIPATPLIGKFQTARADKCFDAMDAASQQRVRALFTQAKSRDEKGYLLKAIAVGHDVDRLEKFAGQIRGKSKTWLRDNLSLANSSKNQGVKQLWNDSCGPATAMALFGELDPVFALRYHQADGGDIQKKLLEKPYLSGDKGGRAVPRGDKGGSGRWIEDLVNDENKATGLTYGYKFIKDDYTIDKALNDLDAALAQGVPVPVIAKSKTTSHYVLALWSKKQPSQSLYVLHDPWTGQTVVRSATQFHEGRLELSGNHELVGISMPTWEK
jgi:hypothetical protein